MEIMAKAAGLLAATNVITLASVSEEGYPRICVMSKTKSEGIKKMWCSTGLSSVKVRHFTETPRLAYVSSRMATA